MNQARKKGQKQLLPIQKIPMARKNHRDFAFIRVPLRRRKNKVRA